jgi:hypothetical protein
MPQIPNPSTIARTDIPRPHFGRLPHSPEFWHRTELVARYAPSALLDAGNSTNGCETDPPTLPTIVAGPPEEPSADPLRRCVHVWKSDTVYNTEN